MQPFLNKIIKLIPCLVEHDWVWIMKNETKKKARPLLFSSENKAQGRWLLYFSSPFFSSLSLASVNMKNSTGSTVYFIWIHHPPKLKLFNYPPDENIVHICSFWTMFYHLDFSFSYIFLYTKWIFKTLKSKM